MSLRNKQNTTYYDQLVTTSQPLTGIVASRWVIFRMTVSITTRIEWWFGRWRLNFRRIRRNRANNPAISGKSWYAVIVNRLTPPLLATRRTARGACYNRELR